MLFRSPDPEPFGLRRLSDPEADFRARDRAGSRRADRIDGPGKNGTDRSADRRVNFNSVVYAKTFRHAQHVHAPFDAHANASANPSAVNCVRRVPGPGASGKPRPNDR